MFIKPYIKLVFLALVLIPNILKSEDLPYHKLSSYEGLHFMVGFMENETAVAEPNKALEQKIFITSVLDAKVKIKFGIFGSMDLDLPANEVANIDVPLGLENIHSEEIMNKLVEINSDVPIMVYAFSTIPRSSDSYAAIPIANWGNEYIAVSLPNDQYNKVTLDSVKDFTPRSSEILIMSAYDGTEVTIIPKSLTRKAKQVNQEYKIKLDKGQCYLVQSWQYFRGEGDLSGTIIRSTKPVGVLSGHVRTALLQGFVEQPPDSKDHLIEMLPPVSSWGKNYISTPFGTNPNKGDYFKIIAKDPSTRIDLITSKGTETIQFSASELVKTVVGLNEPAQWISTAPVQLTQFMYRANDTLETAFYDPSMVILSPVEQFVSKIIFQTPGEVFKKADAEKFIGHFVSIVADSLAIAHMKLNNITVTSISDIMKNKIFGTNLYWDNISVSPGHYEIKTDSGRFSGIIFGIGRFDSYAMSLGSSLKNPYSDDSIPPVLSYYDSCYCIHGKIEDEISQRSYGIYYAYILKDQTTNFDVKISPIAPDTKVITFDACPKDKFKDGSFTIEYMDKSGNTKRFNYTHHAVNLTYDKEINLPGMNWQDSICLRYVVKNDGSSDQIINRPVLNSDNRMKIWFDVSFPFTIKSGDSVVFNICISPRGDSTAFTGSLDLDFGCGITDIIPINANIIALKLKIQPLDFGEVMIGDTVCDFVRVINESNVSVLINDYNFVTGNLPFSIDTTGILPYNILPGDTLLIPVCYFPEDRIGSSMDLTVRNIFKHDLKTLITGKGIAPSVSSVVIDWGQRRVGTTNDSVLTFKNTGNTNAYLTFERFITKTTDDSNTDKILNINDLEVPVNNTTNLNFYFTPANVGNYLIEAELKTNWKLHQGVLLILKGFGTLPVINANDINFEDTEIYSYRDSNAVIIKNNGNEILKIDSIYILDGDISSFEIDLAKLKNLEILPGAEYKTNIRFKPERDGNHKLNLGVFHDANPNFLKSETKFSLLGKAIPPNSSDIKIFLVTKSQHSCLLDTTDVRIKNNGKRNVDLTNLQIEKTPDNYFAEVLNFTPVTITPDEEKSYKILIYADRNKGGRLKVKATFFDNFDISEEIEIIPQSEVLKINLDDEIIYSAGDTVEINLTGFYPTRTDSSAGFYLKTQISNNYLYLIDYPSVITIKDNAASKSYPVKINRTSDYIEFYTEGDIISLSSPAEWTIKLKFAALLSPAKDSSWVVTFSSDKCFDPVEVNLGSKLNDICVFNVRHVDLIKDAFIANIYPNPVRNQIGIKIIMPEDGNIEVTMIDEIGNIYKENEQKFLKKGMHIVYYNVLDVPNGTYLLKIRNKKIIRNIKFIVIN